MNRLQMWRKFRKLSQSQLSQISGVSIRTLQHYEQGTKDINKVAGITLYKLAKALECNVEDLLNIEREEPVMFKRTIYQVEFENYDKRREDYDSKAYFLFNTEEEAREYMAQNESWGSVRSLNSVELQIDEDETNFDLEHLYKKYFDIATTIEVDYLALDSSLNEIEREALLNEVFDDNEEMLQEAKNDEDYDINDFLRDCLSSELDEVEYELFNKYNDGHKNEELAKQFKETALRIALSK